MGTSGSGKHFVEFGELEILVEDAGCFRTYKNIDDVIAAQSDVVEVIARFRPRIVMMTDDPRDI